MDVKNYVDHLVQIGRKVGCHEPAEKQTDITTVKQQEILTGHLMREHEVNLGDCCTFADDQNIVDLLSAYLIDESDQTANNLLNALKAGAINVFYLEAKALLESAVIEADIEIKKSAGFKATQCNQTGETEWK